MTFLKKLTNVLNDPNTDDSILTWSPSGDSFLINVKRLSDSPYVRTATYCGQEKHTRSQGRIAW